MNYIRSDASLNAYLRPTLLEKKEVHRKLETILNSAIGTCLTDMTAVLHVQRWHSWKNYNFVEVSGHNLEISRTWGFHFSFCISTKFKNKLEFSSFIDSYVWILGTRERGRKVERTGRNLLLVLLGRGWRGYIECERGWARTPTLTKLGWIYHHDEKDARKWPMPVYLYSSVCVRNHRNGMVFCQVFLLSLHF